MLDLSPVSSVSLTSSTIKILRANNAIHQTFDVLSIMHDCQNTSAEVEMKAIESI